MSDRDRPLEESPEVAAAVDDDSTVPQLRTGGGADRDNPVFTEPDGAVPDTGSPDLLGDPYAAGTGATGTGTGAGGDNIRTGAEQPWEPEDLVMARGQDLTPENLERARRDLAELGRAAIEKTVP
ncbi:MULTISPECIES: hypothetical protein [Micromonospora]|jgi:hypothetical protein|uniref:Uncharacterized protein n=1 Tax=Micromonospora sicca TaxID=2202420 RepID=A0A317CXC0_9ACTN|nr:MULTISPECIES: hypothetical protein [unclassified Micromonospora]MBM0230068.1 hypothetical protein [Micromonospora sp. ATA51]MDZ5446010.1 hypothetical protein [Micromonospora sp. 4G57]MDZ5494135.1 hypothetical protein [Micromonospora sp. 4G53]PWR06872.1 hypothetical protein DKT69_35890 [Micromonospora sp. 4G51]